MHIKGVGLQVQAPSLKDSNITDHIYKSTLKPLGNSKNNCLC